MTHNEKTHKITIVAESDVSMAHLTQTNVIEQVIGMTQLNFDRIQVKIDKLSTPVAAAGRLTDKLSLG